MIDVNGRYIPGFGTAYRIIKKPSKKPKETPIPEPEPEYELVYLPDKFLPAYMLRIKEHDQKRNDSTKNSGIGCPKKQ
jgi:hypothetical protein